MSRWLPWLTVALLGLVFVNVGLAASDGAPPVAKRAADPFPSKPAAQQAGPAAKSIAPPRLKQPDRGVPMTRCKELRTGKAAIRRALAEKTALEFTETPLVDIIEFLKDHHKIAILLDKKALDDVGVAADIPITCNLKGLSLRAALDLSLRNLGLALDIQDEVLLITTAEKAESHLVTVVYDVADLVTCRDEKGDLWEDYDSLIETITSTLKPTTWDCVGGPGSIASGTFNSAKVLVISQTDAVHDQVAGLLKKIRAVIQRNGGKAEPPRRVKAELPQMGSVMGGTGGAGKPSQSAGGAAGGRGSTGSSHAGGGMF